MPEPIRNTIDVEDLQRELEAARQDILDAEPMAALRRSDALLDQIGWCDGDAHIAIKAIKWRHD